MGATVLTKYKRQETNQIMVRLGERGRVDSKDKLQ